MSLQRRLNRAKGVFGLPNNDEKEKPSEEEKPERNLKNKNKDKGSSSKKINTTEKSATHGPSRENRGNNADQRDGKNNMNPADFKILLQQIHQAAGLGFENLKRKCVSFELSSLDQLDERVDYRSVEVDGTSKRLLPASRAPRYVPLKTTGDGNCLFRAASIFAFGHENRHVEMRVRTVIELAVNSEFYLADEDIEERLKAEIPTLNPDHDFVKNEFEKEVLESARDSDWSSYWHLQALGTVLKRLVQSVYPDHGRSDLRKYYDAVIMPRLSDQDKEPLAIMWTHTTGGDALNFEPNHFVPLISADKITSFRTEEPKNNGHVPSEDDYKSIDPLQSDKKPDFPDADERGNDQRDKKDNVKSGGISRGPYHQETEQNSNVSSGGNLKRVEPGSLVADTITHNVFVMDELALRLDHPGRVPYSQYWLHLAHSLEVPEDIRMLFQKNSDYKPSEKMFAYLIARKPEFTIHLLKGDFSKIHRHDLVSMLDQSSLKGTDNLEELCEQESVTFHDICLKLDCSSLNNWEDLGRAIKIPDNVLQRCARSGGYAETILDIIYRKKPTLQIEEMKDALKVMKRDDVCKELNKLQVNSTIETLRDDYVLRKVCDLLDNDKLPENWKVFAQKFGVSKDECEYLCPASVHSPTRMLMEYLSQDKPNLTLELFLKAVLLIDRRDVVHVSLKKFFNNKDIDIIVDTIQRSGEEQRDEQAGKRSNPLNLI